MALPDNFLVSDEEMIINRQYYIKMRILDYLSELYSDAINAQARQFWAIFEDNVDMFMDKLKMTNDMSAEERLIILKPLPELPQFLSGSNFLSIRVKEDIYVDIGFISKVLRTQISNISRILIYISLPANVMVQVPSLLNHYRVVEFCINIYLEELGIEKLGFYDSYKNFMGDKKK